MILVTDKCNLACKHCMHSCSPKNSRVMGIETYVKALKMASDLGASVVNIAGGEPTTVSSGMLQNYLSIPLSRGFVTTLETNGQFLEDEEKTGLLIRMAQLYGGNFFIQISAFKEYYINRERVLSLLGSGKGKELKDVMGGRLAVVDEGNSKILLSAVGRSAEGEMRDRAVEDNRFPSCINPALLARQFDFGGRPCAVLESYGRLCSPMVDPDGGVHMGESLFCGTVCTVDDGIGQIREAIQGYRPCGGCLNYEWHFSSPETPKERQVAEVLGI